MAGDVSIKFGADIGELKAAMAEASSSVGGFQNKIAGLNAALAQNGFKPLEADVSALRAQFGSFGEAVAEINRQGQAGLISFESFNPIMGELKGAFEGAAQGGEGLSLATAGARRELMVLGYEAVSGNWTRFGPSLMVLAERMGGVSLAMMGAAGGVAALGYAAIEAARHFDSLAEAGNRVQSATAVSGVSLDPGQVRSYIEQLRELKGVSTDEAASVAADFARMKGASASEIQGLITALDPLAAAMGIKVPAAAKMLDAAFSDPTQHGHAFLASIGAGVEVLDRFDAAVNGGHQADGVRMIGDALTDLAVKTAAVNSQMADSLGFFEKINLRQQALARGMEATANNMAAVKFKDKIGGMNPGQVQQFIPVAQLRTQADDIKADLSKTNSEIAADTLAFWEKQKGAYQAAGMQTREIDAQIGAARVALARQTSADVVRTIQDETAQRTAAVGMARSVQLAEEIDGDRRILADASVLAEEKLRINHDLATKTAQLGAETANQQLRSLQETAGATRAGSSERIAAESEVYAFAVRTWGDYSAQAKAAQEQVTAAVQAGLAQQTALVRERQQTDQEVARAGLAAEKDRLSAEVAAGRMSVGQKIAALKELTDAVYFENVAQLNIELASQQEGTAAWEQTRRKMALVAAQYGQDMARYADETALAEKAAAEKTKQAWIEATAPITRAFDGMVSGVLQGTQTIRQATARAAGNMLVSFAEALASMTAKAAAFFAFQSLGWSQLASAVNPFQGGGIGGMIGKATGIGQVGVTAAGGDSSQTMQALTTAITGQTTVTTAATTATQVGSTAVQAGTAATDVLQGATTAASAVQDSTSGGLIGALVANTSAITANTAALGASGGGSAMGGAGLLGGLMQFDVGSPFVPNDMVAQIHQGEIIVPAALSAQVRAGTAVLAAPGAGRSASFGLPSGFGNVSSASPSAPSAPASGSGDSAAGGNTVNFHISALDGASVVSTLSNPQTMRWLAANLQGYWGTNPSTRGDH